MRKFLTIDKHFSNTCAYLKTKAGVGEDQYNDSNIGTRVQFCTIFRGNAPFCDDDHNGVEKETSGDEERRGR